MNRWTIGFALVICLPLVALIAKNLKVQVSNANAKSNLLYASPLKVMVTDIQTKQDWRYGEGRYRTSQDNSSKPQKTWQTYYVITARWMHSRTKQTQLLCWAAWSDYMPKKPAIGDIVLLTIDFDAPGAAIQTPIDQLKIVRADPCEWL